MKMLHYIVGDVKVGNITTLQFVKPAVTDIERAEALLTRVRTQKPERRFEIFSVEKAPGWNALGDTMEDDDILDEDFEG